MEEKSRVLQCSCGSQSFSAVQAEEETDMVDSIMFACSVCGKNLMKIFVAYVSGTTWIEYPKRRKDENSWANPVAPPKRRRADDKERQKRL